MTADEQKIKCPKCGESISIDDVLAHQIEEKIRREMGEKQRLNEAEIANQKRELENQKLQLEDAKKNAKIEVNKKVTEKIASEKVVLWKQAQIEAEKQKATEIKILEEQIKGKDEKLMEANEKELLVRKEKNKLEEERQNFELEKQRQLDGERKKIFEEAGKKATEEQQYVIAQLKKQLTDATKAKDDLARKLEQGSQQTQGEVLELELEEILKA